VSVASGHYRMTPNYRGTWVLLQTNVANDVFFVQKLTGLPTAYQIRARFTVNGGIYEGGGIARWYLGQDDGSGNKLDPNNYMTAGWVFQGFGNSGGTGPSKPRYRSVQIVGGATQGFGGDNGQSDFYGESIAGVPTDFELIFTVQGSPSSIPRAWMRSNSGLWVTTLGAANSVNSVQHLGLRILHAGSQVIGNDAFTAIDYVRYKANAVILP
jgi:hypothetical protein